MLRDILVTSDEEAQRLLAAFKAIPNMQGRLKIVELAERMGAGKVRRTHARQNARSHESLTGGPSFGRAKATPEPRRMTKEPNHGHPSRPRRNWRLGTSG